MAIERIAVVGLGYIGLPTAAVIASRGIEVVGVDVLPSVVETINAGGIHIVEPDLDMAVRSAVSGGKLRAHTAPQPADAFLIAVPTPFDGAHQPDLSFIQSAARNVAGVLKAGDVVILESTSPVGTTEKLSQWLAEARPDLTFPHQKGEFSDIRIAHCPERVLPGQVLRELVDNDRVIGGMTYACSQAAARVYKHFVKGELVRTNARTAEMCKLVENSFRDVNIAFANELSLICDHHDIDVWELIALANRHPRVNILQPGTGVGGHCIAVDPWFIVSQDPKTARLIRTAREVNEMKPDWCVERIRQKLEGLEQPVVACLGLSFKPNVDDFRESPAVRVVERLAQSSNARILVVEPHADALPPSLSDYPQVALVNLDTALAQADLTAVLVRHDALYEGLEGRQIEFGKVLDFVNLFG
ncbi:UDP-N-acetyl-D-mannosaminuronic acid dehydrogenase [Natronospira proteinivora]|uniref:UDP-N-acetyl-D-mannosaminuronic acid dehydrogenase n=1 Tax=Natronospira proteinivora TaxID=1807133 RepID=A0ABT1G9A4_9GAMM|nr:UDP-N-acetyl-D-mannosamine dehydrogenase [Natronospira proteinivora]MCP1727890.1 UDP-N-acetyl-D-mannosaminuronic acid dehydrogenase [Natronospira proteinivora]